MASPATATSADLAKTERPSSGRAIGDAMVSPRTSRFTRSETRWNFDIDSIANCFKPAS
jgi:hypothetical protein